MKYEELAGVDKLAYKNQPDILYIYFAYKNGEARKFNTQEEARSFSVNIEKVKDQESVARHAEFWNKQQVLEVKASGLWLDDLKKQYGDMNNRMFNTIYDKAYERGHSSGHDEVENYVSEYAEFANEVIRIYENT